MWPWSPLQKVCPSRWTGPELQRPPLPHSRLPVAVLSRILPQGTEQIPGPLHCSVRATLAGTLFCGQVKPPGYFKIYNLFYIRLLPSCEQLLFNLKAEFGNYLWCLMLWGLVQYSSLKRYIFKSLIIQWNRFRSHTNERNVLMSSKGNTTQARGVCQLLRKLCSHFPPSHHPHNHEDHTSCFCSNHFLAFY